ncbi:thioredoxin family protein [Streptomyces mutabilis]|uniref:thioredoxin family protein n=1 Tax=Streptomyces mutabilis TaxID=67332 RepID=UPI0034DE0914
MGFYTVDIDKQGEIATTQGINAMPTFIVFKNGEQVHDGKLVGANPGQLVQLLERAGAQL